ncbi:hypothetical protein NC651_016249 [Populus alba x Populus x berolinensis]|nr:hypothetical protein NC651_016249 [Populus alba x Populus x berolinensis]
MLLFHLTQTKVVCWFLDPSRFLVCLTVLFPIYQEQIYPLSLLSTHPEVQVQALPKRHMGLRWITQMHLLMGSLKIIVLKMKNLKKNSLISLILRKNMQRLPHHLLRLRSLQNHHLLLLWLF